MKMTIYKGSSEIGGNCIEVRHNNTRILFDCGLPLSVMDELNKSHTRPVNLSSNKNSDYISLKKYFPAIPNLYVNEKEAGIAAVFISHAHIDHYGLMNFLPAEMPIYMSSGTKELIELSELFNGGVSGRRDNLKIISYGKSINIGTIKVTAFVEDHSAFGASGFLIEGGGKKVYYTGDFRTHGRKPYAMDKIIDKIGGVDCVIVEGTLIGGKNSNELSENEVFEKTLKCFNDNKGLFLVSCSSQNIDRLVSIFKACRKAGKTFVIDPYTAYILTRMKALNSSIPDASYDGIKIHFIPNRHTEILSQNGKLFGLNVKNAKISTVEIIKNKDNLVIKDSFAMREKLLKNKILDSANLIYSMWEGYGESIKEFCIKAGVGFNFIHASGHAYCGAIKDFIKSVNPKCIIPVHTEHAETFKSIFSGCNVITASDGHEIEL